MKHVLLAWLVAGTGMSARRRDSAGVPSGRHLPGLLEEDDDDDGGESMSRIVTFPSAASRKFASMYIKSNWPTLSDTGTDSPECLELGSSGSSGSSMFSWADPDGTRTVTEEWEKIQRTLYDEDGPKVTQKRLIQECDQWKSTFPHLRVVGEKCKIHNNKLNNSSNSDYYPDIDNESNFSARSLRAQELHRTRMKSKRRDQNGIPSGHSNSNLRNNRTIMEEMDSFLHVAAVESSRIASAYRVGTTSSIIRSEISSSRWRHTNAISPDFTSLPHQNFDSRVSQNMYQSRDNSAVSVYSTMNKHNVIRNDSAAGNKKKSASLLDRNSYILEPLEPTVLMNKVLPIKSAINSQNGRKSGTVKNKQVSLPPLQRTQKNDFDTRSSSTKYKKNNTLTPIDYLTVAKINMNGDIVDKPTTKIPSDKGTYSFYKSLSNNT